MDVIKDIRTAYFQAINGLTYERVVIPIFFELVNPSVPIATVNGAEVYIVIQDQQQYDSARQSFCTYNVVGDITIRVVSKFIKKGASTIVEDIASEIDDRIRGLTKKRDENLIGMSKIKLSVNRLLVENSDTRTAYSKIMTYQNELYLVN
jgi:hypothetical protein